MKNFQSENRTERRRLCYIGAGNPASATSGMDVVARQHLYELLGSEEFQVSGLFSAPRGGDAARVDEHAAIEGIQGFFGASERGMRRGRWTKLWFILRGKLLISYPFFSRAATEAARQALDARPDIVVIEHILALANISLLRLLRYPHTVVFIAHNVTPAGIRDGAKLRKRRSAKAFLYFEALQAAVIERLLISRANRTIFISDSDLAHYNGTGRKAVALCPVIDNAGVTTAAHAELTAAAAAREVLFLGTPSFAPNRFAIDWLIDVLAPRLAALAPDLRIMLVGKGTVEIAQGKGQTVVGLGFVDDGELAAILKRCVCLISPVVHGSGIKIKLLEAFAAGCPVLATDESLRGFGFMAVQQRLRLDQPMEAAQWIAALAADPLQQQNARRSLSYTWKRYERERAGALVRAVADAAS